MTHGHINPLTRPGNNSSLSWILGQGEIFSLKTLLSNSGGGGGIFFENTVIKFSWFNSTEILILTAVRH
jgi:hypothetical protein